MVQYVTVGRNNSSRKVTKIHMGKILTSRGELIRETSEVIGYKSGLALTQKEFDEIMPKQYKEIWIGPDTDYIRIRSDEYEDLIIHLLYEVGNIPSLDFDSEYLSPFSDVRSIDWKDTAELRDLFNSRSLDTQYGTFFDQRFINFLGKNFERINDIHWRKFEALTCEFFERNGYYVEIGPGTSDGGIDARAWLKEPAIDNPPAFLIQCKRRKDMIDSGVVKALYADVQHENAECGLIVTTRGLSPSANEVKIARGYPIHSADRSTLKTWIEVMRTPGTGIFM